MRINGKFTYRLLALVIAAIMICSLLFACSSEDNKDKTADGSIKLNGIPKASDRPHAELTFLVHEMPQNYQPVLDEIERRTRNTLNISIKLQEMKIGAPDEDAILRTDKWDVLIHGPFPMYAYDKGYIMDISGLFKQYAPNYYARFNEEELKDSQSFLDSEIIAIYPKYQVSDRRCVVVRRDFMTEFGLPAIRNFEDLERYMELVKKKYPAIIPLCARGVITEMFIDAAGYVYMDIPSGLVYKWDDSEMKLLPVEKTQAFAMAVDTIKRWQEKGYMYYDETNEKELIREGKVACIISRIEPDILEAISNTQYAFDIYPLYSELKYSTVRKEETMINLSISSRSKYPERIIEFLEWVQSSQENYDLLMYGIEGVNYTLEGGKIDSVVGDRAYNGYSTFLPFLNQEYFRTPVSVPFDFKEFYKEASTINTEPPPHWKLGRLYPGPSDDTSALKVFDKRYTALFGLRRQIFEGTFNMDINSFIQEMSDIGTDKYVEIQQLMIDRALESKTTRSE